MTHTSTEQERAEFEAWKEDYALTFEPNYNEHLEADCKAAFLAGMQAARRLQVVPQGWKLVPVGWQFYEDGKWWNGDDRIKDHRKNTEEATHPIRDVYAVEQQSAQPDAAKPNSAEFDGVKKAAASVSMYVEVRECSHCGHIGINDTDGSKAACNTCEWYGDSPREDKCPGCNRVDTMTAACPKCRSRTMLLAETHLLAAAPQAAAHGMVQDAVRYQALVESGNFAPSPFDNGMWGLRVSRVPSTKAELDAAVDRGIAAQAKQGERP